MYISVNTSLKLNCATVALPNESEIALNIFIALCSSIEMYLLITLNMQSNVMETIRFANICSESDFQVFVIVYELNCIQPHVMHSVKVFEKELIIFC